MQGVGRDGGAWTWGGEESDCSVARLPPLTYSGHVPEGAVGGAWPRVARGGWGWKVLQGCLLLPPPFLLVLQPSPALPWGGEALLLVGSGFFEAQPWLSSWSPLLHFLLLSLLKFPSSSVSLLLSLAHPFLRSFKSLSHLSSSPQEMGMDGWPLSDRRSSVALWLHQRQFWGELNSALGFATAGLCIPE